MLGTSDGIRLDNFDASDPAAGGAAPKRMPQVSVSLLVRDLLLPVPAARGLQGY
ncbi:MAG TPA: hypothetical protein VF064_00620 [Pyrinomonadaceae bacterium]